MSRAEYSNPGIERDFYSQEVEGEKEVKDLNESLSIFWEINHSETMEIPTLSPFYSTTTLKYDTHSGYEFIHKRVKKFLSDAWLFHPSTIDSQQSTLDQFKSANKAKKEEKDVEDLAGFLSEIDDGDLEDRVQEARAELNEAFSSRFKE